MFSGGLKGTIEKKIKSILKIEQKTMKNSATELILIIYF